MFEKSRLVLTGLVILLASCEEVKSTPMFLPTSTPPPTIIPASTATIQPSPATQASGVFTSTPTKSPPASPIPDAHQDEPTQPNASQETNETFLPAIALEELLIGLQSPVYVTFASETPPWGLRLFVVEKAGRILTVENGQIQPVPFLDITDRVGSGSSEQGLLSVAFPPDFDTNELFFVNYTDQQGNTVIARFRLRDKNSDQGDPSSERKLLTIAQPADNHNGGQLQFGPDGYLYIGTGDGGRAGDPWANAQNPSALLGKMLRIDVRETDTYRIPHDNPFVGWSDVRSEIWALGLRNPWRFSFDRLSGDLYIADVGQNAYEEISFQPAHSTGGENYGWDITEGSHCFEPESGCADTGLIPPVLEYDHSLGCSITGGYVYRGAHYPQLTGVYFFGDFCSGRIWGLQRTASGEWDMALLLETDINISSFGQDASGELYVLNYRDGTMYHLIALP